MASAKKGTKMRLELRLTDEERELFDRAAALAGANDASEWGRSLMRVEGRRLVNAAAEKKKKKR